SDLGFAEFLSVLESLAHMRGKRIIKVGRFEPTSQTCSQCGHRQPMPLSERLFECSGCGSVMDRDHNAACNIRSRGINSGRGGVRRSQTAASA
ncbi:MAG TPA: transposase, partial [Firmicutes bacterium]|nr:transposase [Bacillota bacterium]